MLYRYEKPALHCFTVARRGGCADEVIVGERDDPAGVLERAVRAMNAHDLDALIDCFHPDYESIQPAHPNRNFCGRDHVVRNWGWVFERFPDFRAELVDYVISGSEAWTEWRWTGIDTDGQETDVRGVMILEISDGMIRTGRLFMEPLSDA